MQINQATIDLVKKWEGFKAEAYLCPAGVWTIGYGITAGAGIGVDPKPGDRVTREQAERHLQAALERFAAQIRPAITAPINDNEFGAFLSLAYNIGVGGFRRSSALRHFNAGDKAKAAEAIKLWNRATVGGKRQILQGLANRRAEEVVLFQTPVVGQSLTSKPVGVSETPKSERQIPVVNRQPAPRSHQNPIAAIIADILSLFKR
jgi:lysozyme